jgi:predicted HTH domain antitoxin
MGIVIDIPDSVARAMRLPQQWRKRQIEIELALALYAQGILSFGKARELAGLDVAAFGKLLGERAIPRHYTAEDLQDDLDYARGQ